MGAKGRRPIGRQARGRAQVYLEIQSTRADQRQHQVRWSVLLRSRVQSDFVCSYVIPIVTMVATFVTYVSLLRIMQLIRAADRVPQTVFMGRELTGIV